MNKGMVFGPKWAANVHQEEGKVANEVESNRGGKQ